MSIPLFSPIYPSSDPNFKENFSFLRCTTHFFNFGSPYKITYYNKENSSWGLVKGEKKIGRKIEETFFGVMVKVIAITVLIYTIVVPLFALLGLLIYRAANRFQTSPNRLSLDTLPREIYQKILRETGVSSIHLAATNKENKVRVEMDPWYQKGCDTLNGCLKIANSIDQGAEKYAAKKAISGIVAPPYASIYGNLYRQVAGLDVKDAVRVIKSLDWGTTWEVQFYALAKLAKDVSNKNDAEAITEFAEDEKGFNIHFHVERLQEVMKKYTYDLSDLASLASIIALSDVPRALKIADSLLKEEDKDDIRVGIVEIVGKSDPEKGFELAKDIVDLYKKSNALKPAITTLALINPVKAFDLAKSNIDDSHLKSFFTAHAKFDLKETMKFINLLPYSVQDNAKLTIIKFRKKLDIESALKLIETMSYEHNKNAAKLDVLPVLALNDPIKALDQANSIADPQKKAEALALIAFI